MITAEEIAKLAGVSRGTVDRALKNRTGINEETKSRILEIAKKYKYTPNIIAKALVYSGHTIKVAVILNSIGNSFFDEVKRGISAAECEFSSYGIEIDFIEFKGYNVKKLLDILNELPPDTKNIILAPIDSKAVEEKINQLQNDGVNVITLSNDIETSHRLAYVGCDYFKSGEVAGRLIGLLSGGSATLCIVTGSIHHMGHRNRINGIESVVTKEYSDIIIAGVIENHDDDIMAYKEMKQFLSVNPSIDFVYITAGGVRGTIRAIKEFSSKIKVCSFDDTVTTQQAIKNGDIIATICQQPYEQGYNAVKIVFDKVIVKKEIKTEQYSDLIIKVDKSI